MADTDGFDSTWNEANTLTWRMHEISVWINECFRNPLGTFEGGQLGYIRLFTEINRLYAIGNATYKKEEMDDVNKTKEELEKLYDTAPGHKYIYESIFGRPTRKLLVNNENLKRILKLCETYEYKVNRYNQIHELRTGTKKERGFFR